MREILFRGKRTDNGEWVEGSLFREEGWSAIGENGEKSGCYILEKEPLDVKCYISGNSAVACNEFIQVSEKTVGQYTGLTDKNGGKIFEGDILKGEYELDGTHGEFHETVIWEGGSWSIQECGCDYTADILTDETAAECEIVGNIYDNSFSFLGGVS